MFLFCFISVDKSTTDEELEVMLLRDSLTIFISDVGVIFIKFWAQQLIIQFLVIPTVDLRLLLITWICSYN